VQTGGLQIEIILDNTKYFLELIKREVSGIVNFKYFMIQRYD